MSYSRHRKSHHYGSRRPDDWSHNWDRRSNDDPFEGYNPQRGNGETGSFSSPAANKPLSSPTWSPPSVDRRGNIQPPNGGGGSAPRGSNLENNLPLAQGSQRPFAQPTTISSMISSLLYQSRQDPNDYWGQFFGMGRGQGGTGYGNGGYGNNRYGNGGGYNDDRYGRGYGGRDKGGRWGKKGKKGKKGRYGGGGGYGGGYGQDDYFASLGYDDWEMGDGEIFPMGYDGGYRNMGNQNYLNQSTADALTLADAYFSPKRLELAYQMGDMETDMKRLAVNLGREVNDPILQAKLYKEALQSVRVLDSEQNAFSLQMVEQRRKEQMQNQQFYDQLALEQEKIRLQNMQFQDQLDIQWEGLETGGGMA